MLIYYVSLFRCQIEVDLCDDTGSLLAIMFGNNAENFLNCTSKTLMLATTEVQAHL